MKLAGGEAIKLVKGLGRVALGGAFGGITDCFPGCLLSHALGGILPALGVSMLLAW